MTREEARKIYQEARKQKVENADISEILKQMKARAEQGETTLYKVKLTDGQKSKLRDLGYVVSLNVYTFFERYDISFW